jgi:hypothetical protein
MPGMFLYKQHVLHAIESNTVARLASTPLGIAHERGSFTKDAMTVERHLAVDMRQLQSSTAILHCSLLPLTTKTLHNASGYRLWNS